jgi:hypothetical protein
MIWIELAMVFTIQLGVPAKIYGNETTQATS